MPHRGRFLPASFFLLAVLIAYHPLGQEDRCSAGVDHRPRNGKSVTIGAAAPGKSPPPLVRIGAIEPLYNNHVIAVKGEVTSTRYPKGKDGIDFIVDDGSGTLKVHALKGRNKLIESGDLPRVGDDVNAIGLLQISNTYGVSLLVNASLPVTTEKKSRELIEAIRARMADRAKMLIEQGADTNEKDDKGMTALIYAALWGNKEIVKLLVRNGSDINTKNTYGVTALMLASGAGDKEVIKVLLQNGADVNCKNNKGETALMLAALEGRTDVVKLLIANGANIDTKTNAGLTALDIAAEKGNTEIVHILHNATP